MKNKHMQGAKPLLTIGILCCSQLVAQQPSAFEVTSIRPSHDRSPVPRMTTNPSGLNWQNVALKTLIQLAYGKKDYTITAPDWLADARYDVVAKLPAGSTLADSSTMLQSLLTERFKLAIHHEEKPMAVYELHVGQDKSKLHATDVRMHQGYGAEGRHLTGGVTMVQLADIVSRDLDRPLLDKTGLAGQFEVDLTWRPDRASGPTPSPSDDLDHPTVFSELRDKLGLKVTSGKAPIDIIVVDHVERIPTEN
jgi:uncharacterized protein (TIGR03435 family)